jgi:DNA-binding transcriptional MerR regulator
MKLFKIGEVAKKAGISVRTLHHYDDIGLLKPSDASDSGHRLYNASDIERLQQVISLKSMGMSLDAISAYLADDSNSLLETLQMQMNVIEDKLAALKRVHSSLRFLLSRLALEKDLSTNKLLNLIKEMNDMENTFTPEQLKKLQERYEKYPNEAKQVEQAWPILFKKFEDAMNKGLEPESAEVQVLAKQAQHFIDLFTGGDKAIEANLDKAYDKNQESALKTWGVAKEVFDYASKARKILNR